jgi:hypothetical protein
MGLLDIWNDWRKETGYFKDSSSNLQTMAQDSDTINRNKINRGRNIGISSNPMDNAINQSGHTPINRQNVDKIYPDKSQIWKNPKLSNQKLQELKKVQNLDASKTPNLYKDNIMQGGAGVKQGEDPSWWQGLANKFNSKFNIDEAMAHWKDKGGFEGLMANPAFTMGLAFMQAGAEGKTLGQGALDNVMKAGGISQHYKQIIEDRKQEPIQATAGDIDEVKSLLKTMNVDDPGWHEKLWGKLKGKNVQMKFDIAAEDIALELQKEMARLQEANKGKKPLVFGYREKERILKRLLREGKFKKKGGTWFTAGTLESDVGGSFPEPKAQGGPIQAGKPYVVGEKGPEIIIPHSSGNVLSNDDSQIYAMLLAANPQLQKVSKTRAERILRSRFPEYFE